MSSNGLDIQSRFIHALRTHASSKPEPRISGPLPCPYGHAERIFHNIEQLLEHTHAYHSSEFDGLNDSQARLKLQTAVQLKQTEYQTPNVAGLSLDSDRESQTLPPLGKKRKAKAQFCARSGKTPKHVQTVETDNSSNDLSTNEPFKARTKRNEAQLYRLKPESKGAAAHRRPTTDTRNERPRIPVHRSLCQPDSRPISQEQLASEVKSIYAGLTMVETKCIHVDRAQAAAPQDSNPKLLPDQWQALVALHRTLLDEHHDFFLASQHPSARPALHTLAEKYTMPARMWKHGIHSFLQLLLRKIPEAGLNYMLAFIYLSYQMMVLLYETVPAFEGTWIKCLGRLGRYKVTIEGKDTDSLDVTKLFKPREEDHLLSDNTRLNTQWLGEKVHGILSRLRSSVQSKSARLHAMSGLHRALALGLLVQKATAASNTQPLSGAAGTESSPSSLGSLLVDKTPFDYVMYGVVFLYLGGPWLAERLARRFSGPIASLRVRKAAKYCSLALTTAMAFFWTAIVGDRLAAGIYITVIKIWAVTTFHFVLVDCCDAMSSFHVAKFIGLAMLFEFIGITMHRSAASSILKALPPALTGAAVVNWALYVLTNHVPSVDTEQGVGQRSNFNNNAPPAVPLIERSGQQQTGVVNDAPQARRRNSIRPVEGPTVASDTSPASRLVVPRTDAVSHLQQTNTAENAGRPRQDTLHHQTRQEDPRFVVGDGFDDVSLHHE